MDAVAVGEIFTSPSAQAFYDAFKAADSGGGVACFEPEESFTVLGGSVYALKAHVGEFDADAFEVVD